MGSYLKIKAISGGKPTVWQVGNKTGKVVLFLGHDVGRIMSGGEIERGNGARLEESPNLEKDNGRAGCR